MSRWSIDPPDDDAYDVRYDGTACEDCGRPVYLGDRQQALRDQHEAVKDRRQLEAVVTRCQACEVKLGDLRVLR